MSGDQALDKLSEKKINSRLLVQEEHCFQKGAQCAAWPQEQINILDWIGLRDPWLRLGFLIDILRDIPRPQQEIFT